MGKLGVVGLTVAAVVVAALLPAREAAAQDFGQAWIDRITHELERERGPLEAKPVNWSADLGAQYSFDNNIFLTSSGKKSDSIIIPFVQANIEYGEPRFDIEAKVLVDYKRYIKETQESGDEERVFFRARQTSSRWNFEISEIFTHVSDPSGLLFINRVSRVVSNTVPKIAFDIGKLWAVETGGNIQLVRFQDRTFSIGQDNNNFEVYVNAVYRSPWAFDLLAQFGYWDCRYLTKQEDGGTPDAFVYNYRAGFRGNVIERLYLEALAGYSVVNSDFFIQTGNGLRSGTGTGFINLRYEVTEKFNFFFDASRLYAWNGFGDPYQLLNTLSIYGTYDWTEQVQVALKGFYEHSHSALDVSRSYYGASLTGLWKVMPHVALDAGATYRAGFVENALTPRQTFTDIILSVGAALTF
jgi:hypothetical protein